MTSFMNAITPLGWQSGKRRTDPIEDEEDVAEGIPRPKKRQTREFPLPPSFPSPLPQLTAGFAVQPRTASGPRTATCPPRGL